MADDITVKIGLDDKASKGMASIARDAKKLDGTEVDVEVAADTKKARSSLDDVLAITRRLDSEQATVVLNARTADVKGEIDALHRDLARLEASDPTVDIKIAHAAELNQELNHIQAELTRIDHTTVTAKVSVASTVTGKVTNLLEQTGITKALSAVGVSAGQAGALAAGAITAGTVKVIGDAANKFATLGGEIEKFGVVSGTSAEQASRFVAVADDYGISADTIAKAVGKLGTTLGTNIDALDKFGVSVAHNKEGGVDLAETTFNVIDAINKETDATRKDALGKAAFGKAWQELIPLIDIGRKKLEESFKGVDKQQIMSPKQLAQAKEFGIAMDNLGDKGLDLQLVLGSKLGPALIGIADGFAKIATFSAPALAGAFDFSVKAIQSSPLGAFVDLLNGPGRSFGNAVGTTSALVSDATAEQLLYNRAQRQARAPIEETAAALEANKKAWEDQDKAVATATDTVTEYNKAIASADFKAAGLEGATKAMQEFATAQFGATDAIIAIEDGIDGFSKSLKDTKQPLKDFKFNFDLSGEDGRKNQQAMENLAHAIDTQLAQAFADSGNDFATFMADAKKITDQSLKPLQTEFGLTDDQVNALREHLGLTAKDWEAKFKLSMDDEALVKLQILQGVLGGLDPVTQATVVADVIAGDPQKALADLQAGVEAAKHVAATLQLDAPATAQVADAVAQTQTEIDLQPVPLVPTEVDLPTNAPAVVVDTNLFFKENPAVIPVTLDDSDVHRKIQALGEFIRREFAGIGTNGAALTLDQGGTAGGLGGIAGERGPEIVNGRYLVTGPTYIPPGTRVTSRRRTEQIIRHHGLRGLKRYDAGGVVPTVTNVTLNAAVIGSTFDVMHAVNDAVRRANRLLPRNS